MTEILGEKELRSQVSSILKGRSAKILALRSRARWPGGELACDGQTFQVCQVRSVLEFHERVLDAEERDLALVCLTELDQHELGLDLVARLFRRRLHSVDDWSAVRSRFQAKEVEGVLLGQKHLARALIEAEPTTGYSKVRGRVLTADKAWSCLFQYALGLPGEYLEVHSLLEWSNGDISRYRNAPGPLKTSARQRVLQVCGPLGLAILNCAEMGPASPLSVGLALRCLYSSDDPLTSQQIKATGKLESYLGEVELEPAMGREWARSAENLAEQEPDHEILSRADFVLAQLQLESYAHLSDLLPRGLEQRLSMLGTALADALDAPKKLNVVAQRALACAAHRSTTREQRERLEMLPRLMRWLHQPPALASDQLGDLARRYAFDTAFADWARLRGEGSHSDPILDGSLRELGQRVLLRLEAEAEAFARTLQAWTEAGACSAHGVIGVEDVLDQVVVPLAQGADSRLLLIVLDGCSWPTLHELLKSLPPDWILREPAEGPLPLVLAAYPSVTEFSRTSLLSGQRVAGSSATEVKNFRDHGALRAACRQDAWPELFHKGELAGEVGGLSIQVENTIAGKKSKVVGVVLNAIDDHLERDDQILGSWRADNIKYLVSLLNLASKYDRTVIIASDHGHVLERGSVLKKGESGGARWQAGRAAESGEIRLHGPRVLCPGNSVVMAWSERLRYTMKKNGYHGGAHPREILAPLVVLAPISRTVPGWVEIRHHIPSWWQPGSGAIKSGPKLNYTPKIQPSTTGQLALFEESDAGAEMAGRILGFPLVAGQWKAQKGPPPLDEAAQFLQMLEARGRIATIADLSQALNLPEVRFRFLLTRVGPLLTVDGVPMVGLLADGQTVFLNPKPVLEMSTAVAGEAPTGSVVQVASTDGQICTLEVPLTTLTALERQVLEGLGRHGRLTELQLKKMTGTKRVAGTVEKLMEKLHKAGFPHLSQAGENDEGRVYVLKVGADW